MKRRYLLIICLFISLFSPILKSAEEDVRGLQCPDANLFGSTLISGVCWSCMFPVYLGGTRFFDSDDNYRPAGANTDVACFCEGDLSEGELPTAGFSVGFWAPMRLIEVVRKPWCFPALFGHNAGDPFTMDSALSQGGNSRLSSEKMFPNFYSWHFYSFPLLEIMDLTSLPQCTPGYTRTFDLMFMSEPFPTWYDAEITFLTNPEALLFGNPIAQSAAFADCPLATASTPSDELFWVAGCWGSNYPLNGFTTGSHSQAASLVATRSMFLLGRLGFLRRTLGSDAVCNGAKMSVLTKSQYRFQQIFPVPESNNGDGSLNIPPDINLANEGETPTASEDVLDLSATSVNSVNIENVGGGCCHNLGANTMTWGEWRQRPGTGEDFVYIIWQWTDCCAGVIGGTGS